MERLEATTKNSTYRLDIEETNGEYLHGDLWRLRDPSEIAYIGKASLLSSTAVPGSKGLVMIVSPPDRRPYTASTTAVVDVHREPID